MLAPPTGPLKNSFAILFPSRDERIATSAYRRGPSTRPVNRGCAAFTPGSRLAEWSALILDSTEIGYALKLACSSTAMIFALYQTNVVSLIRQGAGRAFTRR